MKTLFKLRLTQGKGKLRDLFAKPLSAVITVLVTALYASILIPVVLHAGDPPISGPPAYGVILGVLGFGLMMQLTTLLQNKRSLFFAADAHYLYTGPFSRRKILALYAFDNFTSAMLLALVSLVPITYGATSGSISPVFILVAFLAGTLAQYGLLALMGVLYLWELSGQGKNGRSGYVVLGLLAACLAGVGIMAFFAYGTGGGIDLQGLMMGPELNWVPFFGWARMAMAGVVEGSLPLAAAGLGLLLAAGGVLTAVQLGHKGDFYERSMLDAEAFTEYYQKAREGKSGGEGKIHKAEVRFGKGPRAILSKNWLIALKGRELLRGQDFMVIAIYLAMAFFMGMGFVTFASMLMFWMLFMAGNSSLVDDLQHHYVYLIPGGALQKLLCTLAVPLAKTAVVLLVSLVGGGLLLGEGLSGILNGALICLSILLVMTAGNVLSIRLMKSRSNKMVEQVLRMLAVAVALLPGLVVFILLQVYSGGAAEGLAGLVFSGFNLVFALVVLLCCAPMMQGNELNAD